MFSFLQHRTDCARKHDHLRYTLDRVPAAYLDPPSDADAKILALSLAQLTAACADHVIPPADILHAYGKRALAAHAATNCLADIFLDEAERAATLLALSPSSAHAPTQRDSDDHRRHSDSKAPASKPLAGVPVGIKDCIDVAGHDTTLGFSANANRPARADAPLVRLLRDAGALIYAKTTLPTACLSFECSSDLFGATTNPYNPAFSPGASTGGGAALLAWQGSLVDVGTDIGGSTRYPAVYCGLYAVKSTLGRFPSTGCASCTPGLEAVPTVTSPLARTLDDLEEFWRRVVEMRPWEYDHTCAPIPWTPVDFVASGKKLKFGVIADDGIIPPTPAVSRALREVIRALEEQGHEVVPFSPPDPLEGLKIGYQLMFSDGAASILAPRRTGETVNPALLTVRLLLRLPLFVKRLHATLLRWLSRPRGRNESWAALLETFHPRTPREERTLVGARDAFRAAWHDAWVAQGVDLVLTAPHALPAMPKEPAASEKATLVSANYAFLYNILDCTTGVMPVSYVDRTADAHPPDLHRTPAYQHMSDIARAVHDLYDADAMHGLPVGVQVVGGRWQEERVIAGMKLIERALWAGGKGFVPRRFGDGAEGE
ncbi:amidase signature enzyme [Trametes coccinea BRFM310]|uniref:Amidase signature enzyme n=1 Tax=Trametes coccinea (strain BRFM310) TaxID=1353009 RepID=A0A1Y2J406_TRAC3|nr:amidase signature enzyme [Trametes coccinea BRFM310]